MVDYNGALGLMPKKKSNLSGAQNVELFLAILFLLLLLFFLASEVERKKKCRVFGEILDY